MMNLLKEQIKNVRLYVVFWVIYFSFIVYGEASFYQSVTQTIISNSGKFLLMIGSYHFLRQIVIPLYQQKKILQLALIFICFLYALSILNIGWRVFVLQNLYPNYYIGQSYEFNFKYINRIDWILGIYVFYFFRPALILVLFDYVRDQQKIALFQQEKIASELKMLKTQLNPHFLFNTLNNIYSLSITNTKKTPNSILKLSELLDYMLYQCDEKYVPINNEINHINNYIYLEQLRYGSDRMQVEFKTDIKSNVNIAPLLMLTYIENAFKHGVSNEINVSYITIDIRSTNKLITFQVTNTVPRYKESILYESKIGQNNAQKQLEILYPNEHELNIQKTKQTYKVNLKLKAK